MSPTGTARDLDCSFGVCFGVSGNDVIHGGPGNDAIGGDGGLGGGADVIHGGPGNDFIGGEGGSDSLFGDAGKDVLNGLSDEDPEAVDTLNGGSGKDNCLPSASDALISCDQ